MSSRSSLRAQPARHKLAILSYIGLLAPVYFVPSTLEAVIVGPRILSVGAAVAVIVVLMTYVIMPAMTRLASGWLNNKSAKGTSLRG